MSRLGARILAVALLSTGCGFPFASQAAASTDSAKPASAATIAAQAKQRAALPKDDGRNQEFAQRGFIATVKDPLIRADDGHVIWNVEQLEWLQGDAPPTVNPSIWRQMKLLKAHGLFEVADGVWQVRGIDASNMTVVRGRTGWIVIDPLMTVETAKVALALVNQHLGARPVSAVLYTHSHPDHFGGVRALITPGTTPPIVAPEHLVEESVSENVLAGNAMSRRASCQFRIPDGAGDGSAVGNESVPAGAEDAVHQRDLNLHDAQRADPTRRAGTRRQ